MRQRERERERGRGKTESQGEKRRWHGEKGRIKKRVRDRERCSNIPDSRAETVTQLSILANNSPMFNIMYKGGRKGRRELAHNDFSSQ